LIKVT